MADQDQKQATCPICGYTDTVMEGTFLEEAIQEHMRMAHNQVVDVAPANSDLKETDRAEEEDNRSPFPAFGRIMGTEGDGSNT